MLRNHSNLGLFALVLTCPAAIPAQAQQWQRPNGALLATLGGNHTEEAARLRSQFAVPNACAIHSSASDRTAFTAILQCAELPVFETAAKAHLLPSPRLEVDLSDCLSPGAVVSSIEVKPLGDILLVQQRSSLVVVERATGRKLWCRPFRETFAPADKMVAGVRLSESVGWSMVASGMVENLGLVIIMQADKTAIQEDKSSANGLRWVFSDRIEAIQAATGRVLWQSDWQERTREGRPFWLIGMVDGLLVESPYLYNETQHKPMRLRSAATGNLLYPANPTDRTAIQKAAAHHANKPVLITSGPSVYAIDLLAGTSAYAGLGGAFQITEPTAFPAQHRVVRFFRGDDDMVGHSNWPNYVTCDNLDSGAGWSLPRVVERPLPPEKFSNARPQRISRMVPCRDAGSVLCVGDDKWYGVDVRDGHVLWTNATPMRWTCNVIEAAKGFLVAAQSETAASDLSLAWVDGRTGKFRWLARTPLAAQMQVVGSDLFLFDKSARMHVYSLPQLLTPHQQREITAKQTAADLQRAALLWTHPVSTGALPQIAKDALQVSISAATPEALLLSSLPGSISAIDRQTGTQLWQRLGEVRQHLDDPTATDGSTWSVLGTVQREGTESIVVVKHDEWQTELTPKWQRKSRFVIEGIGTHSGQTVWRSPSYQGEGYQGEDRHDVQVVNGMVVFALSYSTKPSTPLFDAYWDGATGEHLNLTIPKERERMQRILAHNGGTGLVNGVRPWRILRADTGTVETLPLPPSAGYWEPRLLQDKVVVTWVDTDNEMVGHSTYPKYLLGSDLTGRKLWQFPVRLTWRKDAPDSIAAPESMMSWPINIPGTGVCLAIDGAHTVSGLRLSDGKPLWQHARQPYIWHFMQYNGVSRQTLSVYDKGCFGYIFSRGQNVPNPQAASVAYLAANTGKITPVLVGLAVHQVFVDRDTLFVHTNDNAVRAYSIPSLLASSPARLLSGQHTAMKRAIQ